MVVASFVQGFFSEPMKQLGHSGIKKYIKISSASERLTQEIWETVRTAIPVSMTYGYLTKNTRIEHGLPKEHHIDARCISGNPDAVSDGTYYYHKKSVATTGRYINRRS